MAKDQKKKMPHLSEMSSIRRTNALEDDHLRIGGPGFSRVVYCNENGELDGYQSYGDNSVRLTKYTPFTFLPKSLFEQFRRVANFYFLVTALVTGILAFTPLAPYSAFFYYFFYFIYIFLMIFCFLCGIMVI